MRSRSLHPDEDYAVSRFRFTKAEKSSQSPVRQCRLLGVSLSGCYAWKGRPLTPRTCAKEALKIEIRAIHALSRGPHGAPRDRTKLRAAGHRASRKRDFRHTAPDRLGPAAITYTHAADASPHPAAILDTSSRRMVGRPIADQLPTELAPIALRMTIATCHFAAHTAPAIDGHRLCCPLRQPHHRPEFRPTWHLLRQRRPPRAPVLS